MRTLMTGIVVAAIGTALLAGQQAPTGYDDTPMQPNGRWHIHDGKRPQPAIVTPGAINPTPAPPDATVLIGAGADVPGLADRWERSYVVAIPGGDIARCNPLVASRACTGRHFSSD